MQEDSAESVPRALLALLRERFALDWRGIHGTPHWARVRRNGLVLAARTGASRRVVSLFAFLHDSCRLDDDRDAQHGQRADALVRSLRDTGLLCLSDEEAELLSFACRHHSDGRTDADVTVQTCWDADRLDLGRVGKRPDPRLLCTHAARDHQLIAWAYRRSLGARTGLKELPPSVVEVGEGRRQRPRTRRYPP
jgi:uncharacterized protein